MDRSIKKLTQWLPPAIAALLFVVSIGAIRSELHRYGWQTVWTSVQSIPRERLGLALGLMGLNYAILTGYDTLAMVYLRQSVAWWRTSVVGFLSYAISNSIGLTLLSGSAIRYRLYQHWGLSPVIITQAIAFCHLSFWLGLFAVGGITFIIEPLQLPQFLRLPFTSVHPLGWIFLAIVVAYLLLTARSRPPRFFGRWTLPHIPYPISLTQILLTAADWGLASLILFILLPPHHHLNFAGFFGIYLVGQLSGIISNVPGGLGVFETVVLFALTPQFQSAQVLGALLAYRFIYFWVPLLLAGLGIGGFEVWKHRHR